MENVSTFVKTLLVATCVHVIMDMHFNQMITTVKVPHSIQLLVTT